MLSCRWFISLVILSIGLNSYAANFTGPSKYVNLAEDLRVSIAKFWTGKELPGNWAKPCPISVSYKPHEGGGKTTCIFDEGEVYGWKMEVSGADDGIIQLNVLGHEVDHTVRHSLNRRPVVRWMDEGCASLFESQKSHEELRVKAYHSISSPENVWGRFNSSEYSRKDPLATYATGFSVVEWLLSLEDGKEKILKFQGDSDTPDKKLKKYFKLNTEDAKKGWESWFRERHRSGFQCGPAGCPIHNPSGLQAFDPYIGIRSPIIITNPGWTPISDNQPKIKVEDIVPDNVIPKNEGTKDAPVVPIESGVEDTPPKILKPDLGEIVPKIKDLLDEKLSKDSESQEESKLEPLVKLVPMLEWVLPLLGVSLPTGGIGIAAFGAYKLLSLVIGRRKKREVEVSIPTKVKDTPAIPQTKEKDTEIRVVTTETRPPPQQVVTNTEYVSYQKDDYQEAHAFAKRELAKKYPGTIEWLELEKSLISQYLAGKVKE